MVITIPCTKDFERILHDAVSSLDGQSVHIRFDSGRYFYIAACSPGQAGAEHYFQRQPGHAPDRRRAAADWYPLEGQPEAGALTHPRCRIWWYAICNKPALPTWAGICRAGSAAMRRPATLNYLPMVHP